MLTTAGFMLLLYAVTHDLPGDCDRRDFDPSGVVLCLDDDGKTEVRRVEA